MTNDEIMLLVAQVMTSGIKQEGARYTLPESMVIELIKRARRPLEQQIKLLKGEVAWAENGYTTTAREKVAKWMMGQGYATGHGDTIEDLLKELEWQVAEREREACASVLETDGDAEGNGPISTALRVRAAIIRSRGAK